MMHKCFEEAVENAAAKMTEDLGTPATVKFKHLTFVFGDNPFTTVAMPLSVKADKPGYRSAAGKEVSLLMSYCPLCGESLKATGAQP